jgi:hypothetical protein
MGEHGQDGLPADDAELLRLLRAFTEERLTAAQACRERLLEAPEDGAALHAFLREAWETLDGLAREVNALMHALFPDAGLYPPDRMTRQCTFYVVRKLLHECPATAAHPVSELLWRETRGAAAPAYRRLSLLYNLSLFVPLAVVDGRLPSAADVPPAVRPLVRPQAVEGVKLSEGLEEILGWEEGLVAECRALLALALGERGYSTQRHKGHHERQV